MEDNSLQALRSSGVGTDIRVSLRSSEAERGNRLSTRSIGTETIKRSSLRSSGPEAVKRLSGRESRDFTRFGSTPRYTDVSSTLRESGIDNEFSGMSSNITNSGSELSERLTEDTTRYEDDVSSQSRSSRKTSKLKSSKLISRESRNDRFSATKRNGGGSVAASMESPASSNGCFERISSTKSGDGNCTCELLDIASFILRSVPPPISDSRRDSGQGRSVEVRRASTVDVSPGDDGMQDRCSVPKKECPGPKEQIANRRRELLSPSPMPACSALVDRRVAEYNEIVKSLKGEGEGENKNSGLKFSNGKSVCFQSSVNHGRSKRTSAAASGSPVVGEQGSKTDENTQRRRVSGSGAVQSSKDECPFSSSSAGNRLKERISSSSRCLTAVGKEGDTTVGCGGLKRRVSDGGCPTSSSGLLGGNRGTLDECLANKDEGCCCCCGCCGADDCAASSTNTNSQTGRDKGMYIALSLC